MAILRATALAASAIGASALCESVKRYLATVDYSAANIVARFASTAATPEQARLSLTGDATEMFVTWVEPDTRPCGTGAAVSVSPVSGGGATSFPATLSSCASPPQCAARERADA